jgi:predicted SprT family Zn-dependent metalloprotease
LVKPDTVLRWHRWEFRSFWQRRVANGKDWQGYLTHVRGVPFPRVQALYDIRATKYAIPYRCLAFGGLPEVVPAHVRA